MTTTEIARRLWNGALSPRPARVVQCRSTADVVAALRDARADDLPTSVLGGGHDWKGSAVREGAAVIDLGSMRSVDVRRDGTVTVGGGATLGDVLDALRPHGLGTALGTVASVGVAGLVMGGGLGPLNGLLGLGVDNLRAAEVVLADGRVVRTEAEPELLWALRGGGGNVGVVTELTLATHPVGPITTGMIAFDWSEARQVLRGWHAAASADDRLTVPFGANLGPDGPVLSLSPTWAGPVAEGQAHLDRLRALGTPVMDDLRTIDLAESVHALDGVFPNGHGYHLSTRTLPVTGAEEAFLTAAEAVPPGSYLLGNHIHGASTRVPASETAYVHRDEHLVVEILGHWEEGDGHAARSWVTRAERDLEPHALPGGWINLLASDDPHVQTAYGAATSRLLAAKRHYDPDGVFHATALPRG